MSGPGSTAHEEALTPDVLLWAGSGTVVQIGLVVTGHYSDAVYAVWPMPLLLTSVVAAAAYVIQVRRSLRDSAWHGGWWVVSVPSWELRWRRSWPTCRHGISPP